MLFSILGIMLIAFGLLSDPALYVQSLGINVNFRWGIVLLVFGAVMLYLGARSMFWPSGEARNSAAGESRH
jgi:hypothetical protein